MMQVWLAWVLVQDERGWPDMDSISRAAQQAQTATERMGIARWKGRGEPPPMPKETRNRVGTIVPDIDKARQGPQVNRVLIDLDAMGAHLTAQTMRVDVLYADKPEGFRASLIEIIKKDKPREMKPSSYRKLLREGHSFLAGCLYSAAAVNKAS